MEGILLDGISWRCHAPTAHQVGLSILSLILPYVDIPEVTWGFIMDEMKYLTELAVQDYYFSTQRASTTALAAIFNVISDTSKRKGWRGHIMACLDELGQQQSSLPLADLVLYKALLTTLTNDRSIKASNDSASIAAYYADAVDQYENATRNIESFFLMDTKNKKEATKRK